MELSVKPLIQNTERKNALSELREKIMLTKISVIVDEQNNIILMDYDKTHLSRHDMFA